MRRWSLICALAWAVWNLPRVAAADLIFVGDFESGDASGWGQELCCDHSMTVVSTPVRAGQYAVRFERRDGDAEVAGGNRAELRLDNAETGGEYWYGFSIYLPSDWNFAGGDDPWDWLILAQWHGQPDPNEDWRSPPLSLRLNQDKWGVSERHDAAPITTSNPSSTMLWEGDGTGDAGKWTDWVFHIKWSYGDDGFVEVWKDGVQVVDYSGPCAFNDAKGPYFKMGMYMSPDQDLSRHVFHDEMRVGDANSSYQEVAPPGSVGPPPADGSGSADGGGGSTDGATLPDAGPAADGAAAGDGSARGDAGLDTPGSNANTLESGCGCSVVAGSAFEALVILFAVGLVAAFGRRRCREKGRAWTISSKRLARRRSNTGRTTTAST